MSAVEGLRRVLVLLICVFLCVFGYFVGNHPPLILVLVVFGSIHLIFDLTIGRVIFWIGNTVIDVFRTDSPDKPAAPVKFERYIWNLPLLATVAGYSQYVFEAGLWF